MAVKLPDFSALGFDTPRVASRLPQYPENDPAALGLAQFGKGVSALGGSLIEAADAQEQKRQKLNESMATVDLFNRLVPLHQQIAIETDPNKLTELKSQYNGLLETSSQAIDDPLRRKMWVASHSKTILQAHADADTRYAQLYRAQTQADLRNQIDTTVRIAAGSDDPNAIASAGFALENLFESGQRDGAFSPQERYALSKQARGQIISGSVRNLINRGRTDEAVALIDKYDTDLDPTTAEVLRAKAENQGNKAAATTEVDRALGLAPSGTVPRGTQDHINYGATGALGDPRAPGWETQNLSTIASPSGANFKVHKAAADDFRGFLRELEDTGYRIKTDKSGGHNLREMTGGGQLSEHAYGTAIDINSDSNLYTKDGRKVTDLPPQVADIAAKYNLEWGGNWKDPVDTMHFQWRGPQATTDNNFGGIRKRGVIATKAEGGFETYATPEAGVQAISDTLDRYAVGVVTDTNPSGKPLNTIRSIVSTWAPAKENDTPALIARAAKVTGFDPDQPLDLADPGVKAKLIEATIRNEQGGKLPVSRSIITRVAGGASGGGVINEITNPELDAEIGAAPGGEVVPLEAPAVPAWQRAVPLPSYFEARDRIMRNPSLTPVRREEALKQLRERVTGENAIIHELDKTADIQLKNQQRATAAQLLGRAIKGEQLDTSFLGDLVASQGITEEQHRAIRTEMTREGQNDPQTYSEFSRRAHAGEDISADLWTAIAQKRLKGETAQSLQATADSRRQKGIDQVERAAFATLRTVAGMDAQEHPMVDFGKEAGQRQIQLWSLAQQEWNRRVLIDGENPTAVLADMTPRYGRPVEDIEAFPKPRVGAVTKLEDLPSAADKTVEAYARGEITDAQFLEEKRLLAKLAAILEAEKKRKEAAATVQKPADSGAARGRVKAQ